jgi:hypothetical protein
MKLNPLRGTMSARTLLKLPLLVFSLLLLTLAPRVVFGQG